MGLRLPKEPELTEELVQQICELVAEGNYPETVAASLGITPKTFKAWCSTGKDALRVGKSDDRRTLHLKAYLVFEIRKARAEAEIRKMRHIAELAEGGQVIRRRVIEHKDGTSETIEEYTKGNFAGFSWQLERTMPEKFGQQTRSKIDMKMDTHITLADLVQSQFEEQQRIEASRQKQLKASDNEDEEKD